MHRIYAVIFYYVFFFCIRCFFSAQDVQFNFQVLHYPQGGHVLEKAGYVVIGWEVWLAFKNDAFPFSFSLRLSCKIKPVDMGSEIRDFRLDYPFDRVGNFEEFQNAVCPFFNSSPEYVIIILGYSYSLFEIFSCWFMVIFLTQEVFKCFCFMN